MMMMRQTEDVKLTLSPPPPPLEDSTTTTTTTTTTRRSNDDCCFRATATFHIPLHLLKTEEKNAAAPFFPVTLRLQAFEYVNIQITQGRRHFTRIKEHCCFTYDWQLNLQDYWVVIGAAKNNDNDNNDDDDEINDEDDNTNSNYNNNKEKITHRVAIAELEIRSSSLSSLNNNDNNVLLKERMMPVSMTNVPGEEDYFCYGKIYYNLDVKIHDRTCCKIRPTIVGSTFASNNKNKIEYPIKRLVLKIGPKISIPISAFCGLLDTGRTCDSFPLTRQDKNKEPIQVFPGQTLNIQLVGSDDLFAGRDTSSSSPLKYDATLTMWTQMKGEKNFSTIEWPAFQKILPLVEEVRQQLDETSSSVVEEDDGTLSFKTQVPEKLLPSVWSRSGGIIFIWYRLFISISSFDEDGKRWIPLAVSPQMELHVQSPHPLTVPASRVQTTLSSSSVVQAAGTMAQPKGTMVRSLLPPPSSFYPSS